jgi:localization factor PodJL
MKSSAPWSVKGVERDARETAKEAARREGMTVGEWLNQVISSAGEPLSTDGQIEGLKISDLVNAIEHVSKRVSSTETRGAAAFEEASRNLAGIVDRLQRLERVRPAIVSDDPGLAERVARLEAGPSDGGRIASLKALEKAVSQVAVQFDTAHKNAGARMASLERQVQQLAGRVDATGGAATSAAAAAIDQLKTAIDGVSARVARVERSAIDAGTAQGGADAEFVERTGARLRALGEEIKRGGDQIRSLEGAIQRMSEQVDAAERRSSEGVAKVADTIAALRTQITESDSQKPDARADIEAAMSEVARRTDHRIGELQRAFEAILDRLEQSANNRAHKTMTTMAAAEPAPASAPPRENPIEAGIDEALAGGDDDLMFDLDTAAPAPAAAAVIEPTELAPSTETTAAAEDDIDSILAELEGLGGSADPALPSEPVLAAAPRAAALSDPPAAPALEAPAPDQPPNYLHEARRAVKDATEKAAAAVESQQRRKLTPKQRAILAAKVRRKRLAAEQASIARPAAPSPAVQAQEAQDFAVEPGAGPSPRKQSSLFAGAIARGRSLLGKNKQKPGAEAVETEIATDEAPVRGGVPFGRLEGKPVALALGLAIALAAAALLFLVKDVVFAPKPRIAAAPPAPAAIPREESAQLTLKDGEKPEVPAAPVIKPRALYLDSIARLKAATTDAETEAAMEGLRQAASLGHPPAQLQLGELYKLGQGVPQNPAEARAWYERSAKGGNILAMHRIGVMSARGQGGAADHAAAIAWFEKAATLGLVDSQYNLGAIYHPGGEGEASGIQDAAKAYYWYALAARNGDQQAGSLAAGLSSGLTVDQRRALDSSVAAWTAKTPDPDANEVAPAS